VSKTQIHNDALRIATWLMLLIFAIGQINSMIPTAYAQSSLNLPSPGSLLSTSPSMVLPILKGIKIFKNHPLQFDFIIDTGSNPISGTQLQNEASKLIKYFLSSLTIPEEDLWVYCRRQ